MPQGEIEVSWSRKNGIIELFVKLPENVTAHITGKNDSEPTKIFGGEHTFIYS